MRNWGWCKLKYSRGAGLVFALFGLLCGAGRLAGSELSEAIDAGDLPRVEAIIKAHPALLDQAVEASGITPLESALDHQQDAVVGWLIDQGAVPIGFATGQSSNKGTGGNAAASNAATWPFEWAIAHGDVTRLRRLLASAQHLARPPEFYSTLVEDLAAAKQSVAPMVQALLQDGMTWSVKSNRDQYALLFTAAENGDMATVKALLQAGAPANAVNQDGVALLFLVIGCKANDPGRRTDQAPVKPPVPEADRHALVTYLLDHGADPNRSNRFSWGTPLLYAIALREPDLVPVLVEHGAKINMPSPSPMPELPLVVAVEWNEVAVVKYMLAHGANPNLHDDSGYPLSEAIFAATHSRPGYPRPSQADEDAMVRMLVDAGADVNQRDENGDAPMNDLPYEGNERYAEFFLEHGGDPYARPTNTTPAVPLLRDVADNHELTVFLTMYRYLRIVRSNWVLVGGWALWMLAIGWLVARQWREAGRDAQRAEAGAGGRRASGDVVSWFTRRDRLAEEASLTAAERERWNGWHVSMWRLYALSWMFPAAWVGMIVAFALDPMARALTPEELRKAGGVTLVVLLMQGWSPRWLSMNLWERVVASGIVAGVAIAFLSPWIEFYSSKVGDSAFVCLFYAVIFLSLLPVACSVGMHYRRRAIRELVQARKALLPVGAVPVAPVHEEPLGERPGWDEGRP